MSLFGSIMNKIFHHPSAAAAPVAGTEAGGSAPATPPSQPVGSSAGSPAAPMAAVSVDVGAVLEEMAAKKGGGGNYKQSIVDLLRLLDLDSGLDARKALAEELGVHAGEPGTAEQNVALHKAVVAKLAENGGTVPDSMKH